MGYKFNPFSGNFDIAGSGGGGSSVFDGEVQFFSDLPQTVGTPPVNSAYLVRESEGTVWFGNKKQKGIYIRSGNSGVRNDDWTYGGEYPVTSVNGQVGDITLTPADIDAAEDNHSHQPSEIFADAASVTQSGGTGTHGGIYIRNGSDNSKPVYENPSTRNYIWWDSDLSKWFLTSGADVNLFEKSSSDLFPWQATGAWSAVSPQAGTVEVTQATLFNVSDAAASNVIGLKTAKTGNASSTQVVLGNDSRLSDSRTPTAHAASHASSGSDPLAPSDIGAQSIFDASSISTSVSGVPLQLTAARARTWSLENPHSNRDVYLPVTGIQTGDVAVLVGGGTMTYTLTVKVPAAGGAAIIDPANTPSGSPVVISATGQQYRFIVTNPANFNPWRFVAVDTHAHAASAITSGTLAHERGGLEADVSAYNGLVKISGGSTSAVGIGTGSTEVAAGDHTHGNLTNDGKLGSTSGLPLVTTTAGAVTTLALGTANQVLRVNSGATGVEFADPAAAGVTGAASSASDVLGVSGSNITGVDANADRIVFWDDSASALKYLEAGSGLSISGTTLSATASGGSKTYAVFSAEHNQPPASNYATLDTRNSIAVLDFDDATDESAVFVSIIPEGASLGSGLKIRLHWMATTATSGNAVWDVSLERMNTDLDSDSFDTIASGTAAANGTSGILTVTEITLTTIDSVTAGDGFRLKVTRDANNASDTMTGDAELVAVEVRSAA